MKENKPIIGITTDIKDGNYEIEEKYAHPIGILGDLQGPKLRVSLLFCFYFL